MDVADARVYRVQHLLETLAANGFKIRETSSMNNKNTCSTLTSSEVPLMCWGREPEGVDEEEELLE